MAISKVLVVDDAEADRVALAHILDDGGYTVLFAASGVQALAAVASERPDVVLMDVVMEEMDGFKACRQLTSNPETSDIPVIIVSSNSQPVHKLWAGQQGAKAYITKPFTAEQVLNEIRQLG